MAIDGHSASKFKTLSQRQHLYDRPEMYIGSCQPVLRTEWIRDSTHTPIDGSNGAVEDLNSSTVSVDQPEPCLIQREISLPRGAEHIFIELLNNAADHYSFSKSLGVKPGKIIVTMDSTTISISNGGVPMPIELAPETDPEAVPVYVPEKAFGTFLSGTNLNDEELQKTQTINTGKNGIGSKATNTMSTHFQVIVFDAIRKKSYTQVWENNMTIRHPPVIEVYTGKESSVTITYQIDFQRFSINPAEYSPDVINLFARHAMDLAGNIKGPVVFNDVEYNFSFIKDRARLYYGDLVNTAIIHYQWPKGVKATTKATGEQYVKNGTLPLVEMLVMDAPDSGLHVSFVNSILTREGGIHVDSAIKAVVSNIVKTINSTNYEKLKKALRGVEPTALQKRQHSITYQDVVSHLSLFISIRAPVASWTTQTKEYFYSYSDGSQQVSNFPIKLSEKTLRPVYSWNLIARLNAAIAAKQYGKIAKSTAKVKAYVDSEKITDAIQAGKEERSLCTLCLTEGDSGKGYADKYISNIPTLRTYFGVLPLRGKCLNVMNATSKSIEDNAEFRELKKVLGLEDLLPEQRENYYLDDDNFAKLRYGKVLIMADADVDGKHIAGLILLYFHVMYPCLLKRPFLSYYRTPIVRMKLGKNVLKFYNQYDLDEWKKVTPNSHSYKAQYFKGLATSSEVEVIDDYRTTKILDWDMDELASNSIHLAFHKDFSNNRKDWITAYTAAVTPDGTTLPVTKFINEELITFSIDDIGRSLANLMDGFKESNRKIMHASHKKFHIGVIGKKYDKIKVEQLSSYTAEQTDYHHGAVILNDVIVKMAQTYMGSNNIPWFNDRGGFGSRVDAGKDAGQSRYIFTSPTPLVPLILRKEDQPILTHRLSDSGDEIEPVEYYPIIPMVLVNGPNGIGTGWSQDIPNYNPIDIIEWLQNKLRGGNPGDLVPWYPGFTGTINVVNKPNGKQSVETVGKYEQITPNMLRITELPIHMNPTTYKRWLDDLLHKSKYITGADSNCIGDDIDIVVKGFKYPTINNLRLNKSKGIHMVLLTDGKPIHYKSAQEVMETFYEKRLVIYQKRKDYQLEALKWNIEYLKEKMAFLQAVNTEKLVLHKRSRIDILADMRTMGFREELYTKGTLSSLANEDLTEFSISLTNAINDHEQLLNSSIHDLWLADLAMLAHGYELHYGRDGMKIKHNLAKMKGKREDAPKTSRVRSNVKNTGKGKKK